MDSEDLLSEVVDLPDFDEEVQLLKVICEHKSKDSILSLLNAFTSQKYRV